jgi:segregation and condensation protein B
MTEQNDMTTTSMIKGELLQQILEASLLAAGQPLSPIQLAALFSDEERPPSGEISRALEQLRVDCANRGVELKKVASGYRLQVKQDLNEWVSRLWKERPQRYSRALLETMALIAYRQPITRGEIESVRGVSVSTNIIRTLQEREWIRVVGHRDVPGKPALFGSTKTFLDSFDLQNLDDLPTLAEIRDMENLEPELHLEPAPPAADVRDTGEETEQDIPKQ